VAEREKGGKELTNQPWMQELRGKKEPTQATQHLLKNVLKIEQLNDLMASLVGAIKRLNIQALTLST